jgi:hypothetical protein
MRYVEGPHKVKERIRWGNGVTPVGGQVLMQGIAVVGEVYGGSAPASASLAPRSASEHGSALDFWKQQSAAHQQLTTQLNGIRSRNSLPSIDKQEIVTKIAANQPGAGKFDAGEDFIGVKAEISGGTSKALFPQVAYRMNDVIRDWNAIAETLKGKRLGSQHLAALKMVESGIRNAIESGNGKVKFPFKTAQAFVPLEIIEGSGEIDQKQLQQIRIDFNNLRFAQIKAAKYVEVHESKLRELTVQPEKPFDAILLRNITIVNTLSLLFSPDNAAMKVFYDPAAVEPAEEQKRGAGAVANDDEDVIGLEKK